jgi:hypothetical protein
VGECKARSWREEANCVFDLIKQILCKKRHHNLVLLASQRSEDGLHLCHLIGHQNCLLRFKLHLVSVLLWYAPLVLNWDARLIFDGEFLFGRDTRVTWREENLLVLESHLWAVAESLKQDLLHVRRRIVKQELSGKVVKSRSLWVELETNQSEGLA